MAKRIGAAIVAWTLIATVGASATAQESEPDLEFIADTPELWEGPWDGFLFAGGTGTQGLEGIDFVWTTDLTGTVTLESNFEAVEGSFELSGPQTLSGTSPQGTLQGIYTVSGAGQVIGPPGLPSLSGNAGTAGQIAVTAGGVTSSFPASSPPTPFAFEIELTGAACNEIYGRFDVAFEQAAETEGWSADLFGNVVLVQDAAYVQAALDEWLKDFAGPIQEADAASTLPDGTPPIIQAFDVLLRRYNSWVDTVNTDVDILQGTSLYEETRAIIEGMQHLYADFRNLSECEVKLLGPLRDSLLNILTQGVQEVAIRLGYSKSDMTAGTLYNLTMIVMAVGGLGSGSRFPEQAARVDEALQLAAVRILERHLEVGTDDCPGKGCLLGTDEVRLALTIQAQMGWDLEVNGVIVDPFSLLAALGVTIGPEQLLYLQLSEAT